MVNRSGPCVLLLCPYAGKNLDAAKVTLVILPVAIAMANLLKQGEAIVVATDPAYAPSLGVDDSNSHVFLLMELLSHGYLVAPMSWL